MFRGYQLCYVDYVEGFNLRCDCLSGLQPPTHYFSNFSKIIHQTKDASLNIYLYGGDGRRAVGDNFHDQPSNLKVPYF